MKRILAIAASPAAVNELKLNASFGTGVQVTIYGLN